jgi:transcription elongation factor Elf1
MYSHCPKCGSDKNVRIKVVEQGTGLQYKFGCHTCELFGRLEPNTTYAKAAWDNMIFDNFVDR